METLKEFIVDRKLKTQLRVAGGWVRDKLLGLESNDIDIALDDMMGETFVRDLQYYLDRNKEESKIDENKFSQDKGGKQTRGFGVIKFNPEKSKHLETATIKIKGQWIDFVNLRGEEYTKNSRIPEIVS